MSLFRYRVDVSPGAEQCFSVNNLCAARYNHELDFEFDIEYFEELYENDEIDYELCTGIPICYVLYWDGPKNMNEEYHLDQMTKHKRTPWMLDNVSIDRYGGVDFSFTPASPCNASDARDSHEFFDIMSSASFDIILETRSDSFAKSRYKIKRFRFTSPNSHEEETIFEVTERTGNYLRHLLFHFPNTGKAYCDVAEYRR